eukprot:scaffold285_cov304-Pinguiococcus_pyrenoidosus.AAC.14
MDRRGAVRRGRAGTLPWTDMKLKVLRELHGIQGEVHARLRDSALPRTPLPAAFAPVAHRRYGLHRISDFGRGEPEPRAVGSGFLRCSLRCSRSRRASLLLLLGRAILRSPPPAPL